MYCSASLSSLPGTVSAGLIFLFSHMSIYFHHIHLLTPFPYIFSSANHNYPQDSTWFTFLFSAFVKQLQFCLFKIATQDILLWHFHVYMNYILNWFIPSSFLLSTLVPFSWWYDGGVEFNSYKL
jgi:hypothetical protein